MAVYVLRITIRSREASKAFSAVYSRSVRAATRNDARVQGEAIARVLVKRSARVAGLDPDRTLLQFVIDALCAEACPWCESCDGSDVGDDGLIRCLACGVH